MKTQLNLGKNQIARNLNNYRMAKPTEDFWTEWNSNKEQLKSEGVSVFKRGTEFYVAIYDGTKSTQEELDKQNADNFAEVKSGLLSKIFDISEHAYEKDINEAVEIVENATSFADFDNLKYLIDGVDYMLAEVQDDIFQDLLG